MLKLTLLQQMLVISIALSTITCAFVQKTKKCFSCSNCLWVYSLVINIILGILFCISFTTISFPDSLWVGFFSFIGADTIYKSLEGKLASYSSLVADDRINIPKENIIKTGSEK